MLKTVQALCIAGSVVSLGWLTTWAVAGLVGGIVAAVLLELSDR